VTNKLELLTYYSASKYEVGDLVLISIRSRKVNAIICNVENILNSKQDIKKQDFKYRKVEELIEKFYISTEVLINLQNILSKFGLSVNEFFNDYFPVQYLSILKFKKQALNFNSNSIVHIYPTSIEASLAYSKSDIPNKVLYHSNLSNKKKEACVELCKTNLDINLYTTPNFIFLLLQDLKLVKFHNTSSKYYTSVFRGINSFKLFLDVILLFNIYYEVDLNTFLDLEYLFELNEESKNNYFEIQKKLLRNKNSEILDMKKSANVYIHEKLVKRLINSIDLKKKVLIYTLRKGVATSSICADCCTVASCSKCNNPYVLKEYNKEGKIIINVGIGVGYIY
jgi:primosomal protein N'